MSQINCKGLSIGYNKTIKGDINFSVNKGDYLTILGENGCGKTTLMKTILGLEGKLDGEITFDDLENKKSIGYLPQHSDVQGDFPAAVLEIVLSGCLSKLGLRPFYSREHKQLALSNLKRLGIEHLKKRSFSELSGGQQQRVLLARSLCATSEILVLDEPVTGLDPNVTEEMYQLIKELNDSGISIIMISHDIEASMKYSSHILYMGNEMFFGTKDEFFEGRVKNDR